jgi:hypothetical protein
MAQSDQLRTLHYGTVINMTSKGQEKEIIAALRVVEKKLEEKFFVRLAFIKEWRLKEIVVALRKAFPKVDFVHTFDSTFIRPDGGILFLVDKKDRRYLSL